MAKPNDYITATRKNFISSDNEGRMVEKCIIEIQGTFLVKIRDCAFNGNIGENAFIHIDKFLEIVRPIKINGLTQYRFRLSVFSVSLACATNEWFTKECIGLITTWDNMVKKFIINIHHLSDHDEEEETEEDDNPNEMDNLNNDIAKGIDESWSENEVPYQLCDHICEPHHFKNGKTKWPTCTSDIDRFCNGGELPGMVRVESITYFQNHKWYDELADGKLKEETLALKAKIKGSWGDATPGVIKFYRWLKNYFENIYELDYEVLEKLQECWWKVNAYEIAPFTHTENFRRGPYANMKTEWTSNPYLDVNRIFGRNYKANIVMSDSEDSIVTYTEVSSLFEDLSDIGSSGVDGLPMMPEDPYAYVVAAFQTLPSPDYVPGPVEPEHAPPSPEFVPEPVYPKFMPPEDEVFPTEEQPLPAAVSLTTDSPGYIADSDPEEDGEDPEEDPTDYPTDGGDDDNDDDEASDDDEDDDDDVEEDKDEEEEEEHPARRSTQLRLTLSYHLYTVLRLGYSDPEEDEEDPEEDPTDYPTDGGDDDNDDDEASDDDEDDDDDVEEEEDEEEEEEQPTPTNSVPPPVHHVTARMFVQAQTPISLPLDTEVARLLAIPTLPPSPLSPLSSPLPLILSPLPQILSPPLPVSSLPLPSSPTYPLGYRAAMIQLRAEIPFTSYPLPLSAPPSGTPPLLPIPLPTSSPPLLLPFTVCRAAIFEVTLLPQKSLCIALGLRYEVGKSLSAPTARPTRGFRADYRFVGTLDNEIRRDPERGESTADYSASTANGDCKVTGSRPHPTGTACGDTNTIKDIADTCDRALESARTRWRSSTARDTGGGR
ncbi:hypothetical protein Tco_0722979 [Tanacetum coccineum]